MTNLLKNNIFRFSISLLIALILSLVANFYLAVTEFYLIPLTALYVMQTSIGNEFYQGIRNFIFVLVIVVISALALHSLQFFYQIAHDTLVGAVIGIAVNLVVSRQPDTEFRNKLLPVIKIFNHYFSMIIDQLLQQDSNQFNNTSLENALLTLPDWVYERGFNSALQNGYQFFLIKIEQISDILFSMHYLARYQYDKELIAKIRPTLLQYVENVNQFFSAIETVLQLIKLEANPSDLENEISELQKQFFAVMPSSLELWDMQRDYVYLAAFIYNLKDLQKLLLKLGESLR
ncbi:MAG TPA: hypothetical protein VLI69_01290 [Gammaproteobacteria bacterium]|nr:hypothetical protein [Gammaproteobacteria bacterium]